MSVQEALGSFPDGLVSLLRYAHQRGGSMADAMFERREMSAPKALMVGLALDPVGRKLMDAALDEYALVQREIPIVADEVVIGGGAHAAIYCAVRNSRFGVKPLVLERNARFGGTFAMTRRSSFFLNSRNRPGALGAAGSQDALNVIPGAPMQPSDLGGAEYQANADLGMVVRATLALNAEIRQAKVNRVTKQNGRLVVVTDRGPIEAKRVIVTTGIGKPRVYNSQQPDGKVILSFSDFMERFDSEMFPLRGLKRVAVIGGGDSGRTVVEAIAGYGPDTVGSVASLDYVERIDWYGIEPGMTKERWLACNRTRYKPLAALFPDSSGLSRNARVRGLPRFDGPLYNAYDAVRVGPESYDMAVICIGYEQGQWYDQIGLDGEFATISLAFPGSPLLGRTTQDGQLIVLGPAAYLPFDPQVDPPVVQTSENRVALFRLAPRTAAVAERLPLP